MSLNELLPTLRALSRADRLRLVQFLVGELAQEEGVSPLEPNHTYPVWTPHHAFEGAATLLNALNRDRESA